METKFQTSFIPKKPLIPQENVHVHNKASILMIIATFLFIASLAGAIFTVVTKAILIKSQEQEKRDLAANEQRFNVPLIEELKKANIKIDLAKDLLTNHIAVSEVFHILNGLTIDGVRFTTFEFIPSSASNAKDGKFYKISMKGLANSFSSVAFQSDVFGRSDKYGTNKIVKNPILSDLAVDPSGNVSFNFSADLALPDISYANILKTNE